MPKKPAVTSLNASTLDILNVIRQNASMEYQDMVPKVTKSSDIPKVGEVLMGYPAMANQFISALLNRIALVVVRSATFNNPYKVLKKGYIQYGETIEEIFVNIARVREFDVEKAEAREFKRSLPDVRAAFHIMNWRVQYPVTIQDEDLRTAFLSMEGVQDLIARIVDSVYKAAEYDEFLLFKYLLIKAISHGTMYPVSIGDGTKLDPAAVAFRGYSNQLTFMGTEYNQEHVLNNTPRENQVIFMDSFFNAQFDVEVLAASFHMEKADFMGRLFLIDNWTTFDNERFNIIRKNSDMIEEVTQEELNLLKNVKAVIVDENWFQVYDNNEKWTEKYVASGMYWNYFLNIWKTISTSPYSNAIVFVTDAATITVPDSITAEVAMVSTGENATVINLEITDEKAYNNGAPIFIQTEDATQKGIAVHRYGAIMFPADQTTTTLQLNVDGKIYTATEALTNATPIGTTLTFNP